MTYHLETSDRSLQEALRRIALHELDAALARLGEDAVPGPTAVHEVRKHVKKLRGLLRLVRPGFAGFRAETDVLRAAAQSLSSLRDAEVRLVTFDKLVARDRPAHLSVLRAELAAARDAAAGVPASGRAAHEALAGVRGRAAHWDLRGRDRDLLIEGLADTRRQARRAMAEALETRSIDALHDWRKRVKDGWYQARLLVPVWPAVMTPLADQAGLLAEDLGDHHDLAVLSDHLSALPEGATTPEARAEAIARAGAAMATLEARVFPLGITLLAGKPEAVARLWSGWWQAWRVQDPADGAPG